MKINFLNKFFLLRKFISNKLLTNEIFSLTETEKVVIEFNCSMPILSLSQTSFLLDRISFTKMVDIHCF